MDGTSYYPLGREYDLRKVMPPEAEHCVSVDGGPIRFEVEARVLSAAAVDIALRAQGMAREIPDAVLDDAGASLHVFGAADGVEHLRFDCFDQEPHYHYLRHGDMVNQACRIDEHAVADPVAWSVECVRTRLPEMLVHAGAHELAAEVKADPEPVRAALPRVVELLRAAERASTGEQLQS